MISCHLHDYIEIACMYQYPVKFTMKNGKSIECTALDTKYNDTKEECIKVRLKPSQKSNKEKAIHDVETLIPVDDIATLEILIENPHFSFVSFLT